MKKIAQEYFQLEQESTGKIREKAMLLRIAFTVFFIVSCMIAMSFSAFAYFSSGVESGHNVLQAANFDLAVSVTDQEGRAVELTTSGNITKANLFADQIYQIALSPTEESMAQTGFCVITLDGSTQTYHTGQIEKGGELVFDLTVKKAAQIEFLSHWGTSSYYAKYQDKGTADELYIAHGSSKQIDNRPKEILHTVSEGETLTSIAQNYQTTVEKIALYNDISDANLIRAGKEILIPPSDWTPPTRSDPADLFSDSQTQQASADDLLLPREDLFQEKITEEKITEEKTTEIR